MTSGENDLSWILRINTFAGRKGADLVQSHGDLDQRSWLGRGVLEPRVRADEWE